MAMHRSTSASLARLTFEDPSGAERQVDLRPALLLAGVGVWAAPALHRAALRLAAASAAFDPRARLLLAVLLALACAARLTRYGSLQRMHPPAQPHKRHHAR
jgi:hypothetical protein